MTQGLAPMSRRRMLAFAASLALPSLALPRAKAATSGTATMRLRFTFADQSFTATMEDNPWAQDLLSMLPLDLTITDYSTNEKIAYLPRKLIGNGSDRFVREAAGDLCYFAPWGNLAFFHAGYRWSSGLIRLGRLDGGVDPLLVRGEFPLRAAHA
ncbi:MULTISPECIES: cyclophilin-like fold protein [unclassified Haematobacter]|uniref:cyclophilin-like fold protein n=1 Tax=unclassified Haematobacter TaxID=2640585 RepID=UPI0025C23580|nr:MULTISPECIES: cyclophilin-like fold protein [unclassified Haematobacter]